ncbi:RDD family protein [Mycolicibacterium sp. 018/SC-01/001]|uniref:RDD family protein n=1 Tax=Mycolicibacterium sp. 018/SC-01/001 TaxID=2592069 RepID=UPI00117ED973|nr:RDD family protein [Mycolicibacterium sp. 018/SC-01/001]TRW88052.1 RDD family protein [Mycolicibacterium sp. 018/SC-01/001]
MVLPVTDSPPDTDVPEVNRASWSSRAGALLVDVLPGAAVIVTTGLLALASPADGWARWAFTGVAAVALFATAVNRLVLPVATGWTLGRALCGIAVRDGAGTGTGAVGIGRLAVRELAHLLDTLSVFVGWLWPLWDRRRRTFADMLARTEVLVVERPARNMRRLVALVLVVAALVCAAAAGVGYLAVYQHERAVDAARAQIDEQGPRIVEQMLSYSADTMAADFARAQGLTTDTYREQLIAQQQAAQKAGIKSNEYWAVSHAVLTDPPVTPDQASMLLAMQGQRGDDPKTLKFITATVRVDFDRASDGRWQVANLTVLKKPQMNPAGQ